MLVFSCPSCGVKLQMSEELAGKKVRCASCQAVVQAPAAGAGNEAISAAPPPRSAPAPSAVTQEKPRGGRSTGEDRGDGDDRGERRPRGGGAGTAAKAGMGVGMVLLIVGVLACCLVTVVVGGLAALIFPAIGRVQNAAQRAQTTNNMKQVSLGIINYADTNMGRLPTPKMLREPQMVQSVELSWRVAILPYVEQPALFNRFDRQSAWDSPANQLLMNPMPVTYEDLLRDEGKKGTNTRFQYFTGPGTLWPTNEKKRFPADFPDGTSNTFLFVEADNPVPWSKPADIAIQPGQSLPLPKDRFLAACADGSVHTVERNRISDAGLLLWINPADNQIPPPLD
jgi:LSD1 subclass zinc finger protein